MELSQSQAFSEPLLAAMPQLKEKPCLGVPSKNPALYPGQAICNSTIAIGLRAALHLDAVRSRYTGKERDAESGNDYFEARYYSSSMGRFMSPDWSAKEDPVPYATFDDPQSLNLYAYVRNNPLSRVDADGHCCDDGEPRQVQYMPGGSRSGLTSVSNMLDSLTKPFQPIAEGIDKLQNKLTAFADAHPELVADAKQIAVMVAVDVISKGRGSMEMPVEEGVPTAPSMRAAQREVMRTENIPTSQQPTSQQSTDAGRQYTYEVPKPGGGTETKVVQRNTGTDSSHPGQPHVEGGRPKPGGQTDSLGRPRLQNNKTKVNVAN